MLLDSESDNHISRYYGNKHHSFEICWGRPAMKPEILGVGNSDWYWKVEYSTDPFKSVVEAEFTEARRGIFWSQKPIVATKLKSKFVFTGLIALPPNREIAVCICCNMKPRALFYK